MDNRPPIIEIKDLSFSYDGEPVLQKVNLKVWPGDFMAVIGPNGSGKTTLLKLILGLLKPDRGLIGINGEFASKAASGIGYVPQNANTNRSFPITALDVVLMGKLAPGKHWPHKSLSDRQDALTTLERLGVAALAEKKIELLSGGQRQRVFIARALVAQPKLLLLDEPTASIDTKSQTDFYTLLKELNKEITILVVSHDLLVISRYIKSVACVNKGLHYHDQAEITSEMMEFMYPGAADEVCPVELVAHGLPHRVLKDHQGRSNDRSPAI